MRRIIIVGTALAVLVGAGVALAAGYDTFSATQKFTPNAAGSTAHPSPLGFVEKWTGKATKGGNAAPLVKIVAKIYGVTYNGGHFPTCTTADINKSGNKGDWNKVCNTGAHKGSLIGKGPVQSVLTSKTGAGGTKCDPYLYIYNAGQNKQTFFFTVYPQAPSNQDTCSIAKTGTSCAPYYGNLSKSGKWAILTINLPGCASTDAGGLGAYAALKTLNVTYSKLTKKVNGKTIGYSESTSCKSGKRPWSFTFTWQEFSPSTAKQSQTVNGSQACS